MLEQSYYDKADEVIASHGLDQASLIPIIQDIQSEYRYLPPELLGYVAKKLGITESAISQHLKVMKEAGLVYGEKYGYHMHYLPSQNALDSLVNCFTQMKEKSNSLDRDITKCQCEYREASNEKAD